MMDRTDMVKVHETAYVDTGTDIGKGTYIWQYCIVQDGAVIGTNCTIGANVFIEQGVQIGNGVKIKNNVAVYSGVVVEDDAFLGPNCVFTNVINPRSFINRKHEFKRTVVKKGASIGANATIICGNTIGRYAMIGAGSVITKDVPDYAIIVGNPGKIIGYICKCGCKLNEQLKCVECGKEYAMDNQMKLRYWGVTLPC